MILQHNMSALNAKRNLGKNKTKLNKNLEKLSSGYKINRAGDDAAGLAISESMRNKLKGLDQAENNVEDGISLIQVAEGALTEVHAMLERGTTLATQAANGTYTDDVRKHIDAEFQELKKEIDRISENTEFNGINLLNGIRAAGDINSVISVHTVDEITQSVKDVSNIVCNVGEAILNAYWSSLKPGFPTTDIDINLKSLPGSTLATAGGTMLGSGRGHIVVNADLDKIDSISTATYESTLAHEMMHGVMGVALANADTSLSELEGSDNLWFIEGTAQLTGGIFTAGWNYDIRDVAKVTSGQKTNAMKAALANHGSPTDEVYGTGALMTAYIGFLSYLGNPYDHGGYTQTNVAPNIANINSGIDSILYEIINNHKSLEQAISTRTGFTKSAILARFDGSNSANDFVNFLVKLVDNETGSEGSGSFISGLSSSLNNPNFYNDYTEKHFHVNDVNTDGYGKGGGDVVLQIGPTADETITIYRFNMSSDGLGLGNSNVTSLQNANKAMGELKDAVEYTSATRAYFGAKHNRLEHTLSNLKVSNENTTAAESRIRDTDMAKEISAYTKNNILQQAAQSMLAQANQSPQSVLSLLG